MAVPEPYTYEGETYPKPVKGPLKWREKSGLYEADGWEAVLDDWGMFGVVPEESLHLDVGSRPVNARRFEVPAPVEPGRG